MLGRSTPVDAGSDEDGGESLLTRVLNHDNCDSCGEGGDLICCDRCPASFHLECLNPPLPRVPEGDWFCRACAIQDMMEMTIMGRLLQHLEGRNPVAFSLPASLIKNVEEWGMADGLGTLDDGARPGETNFFDEDASESDRPLRQGKRKRVRNDRFCSVCSLRGNQSELAECAKCPHSYHLWCLDPPLLGKPTVDWLCPSHSEPLKSYAPLYNMRSRRGQTYIIPKTNIRLDFPFSTTLWTPPTTPSLIALEQNGIAKGHARGTVNGNKELKSRPSRQEQREWLSGLLAFESELKKQISDLSTDEVSPDARSAATTLFMLDPGQPSSAEESENMQLVKDSEDNTTTSVPREDQKTVDVKEILKSTASMSDPTEALRQLPPEVVQQLALQRLEEILKAPRHTENFQGQRSPVLVSSIVSPTPSSTPSPAVSTAPLQSTTTSESTTSASRKRKASSPPLVPQTGPAQDHSNSPTPDNGAPAAGKKRTAPARSPSYSKKRGKISPEEQTAVTPSDFDLPVLPVIAEVPQATSKTGPAQDHSNSPTPDKGAPAAGKKRAAPARSPSRNKKRGKTSPEEQTAATPSDFDLPVLPVIADVPQATPKTAPKLAVQQPARTPSPPASASAADFYPVLPPIPTPDTRQDKSQPSSSGSSAPQPKANAKKPTPKKKELSPKGAQSRGKRGSADGQIGTSESPIVLIDHPSASTPGKSTSLDTAPKETSSAGKATAPPPKTAASTAKAASAGGTAHPRQTTGNAAAKPTNGKSASPAIARNDIPPPSAPTRFRVHAEIEAFYTGPLTPAPKRTHFFMTGRVLIIGRRKMFEPNNAENREENSLDLSQYPKANLISRKHLVVTMGATAGEFTVENFARNATHLNSEPLQIGKPKQARLPFDLNFADMTIKFKQPSLDFAPQWWIQKCREDRDNWDGGQ